MENIFKSATDEELKVYCQQYREWQKTGMIPDNELGKIRDLYSECSNAWQINLIADLLDVLMERWMRQANERLLLQGGASGLKVDEKQKRTVEKATVMEDGITICCGYDFGVDMSNKKIKYCPICGKRITIRQ